MQFPILSIIVFAPFIAAVIMLLMKPEAKNEIRVTALAAAVFDLVLSAWVYYQVYMHPSLEYQFIEKYDWLPVLGISLHFGVDGMSAPLVLAVPSKGRLQADSAARLKAAGARFRNEIIAGPGGRQVLILDPSGNVVELFEPARHGA